MIQAAKNILNKTFGYDEFRPLQKEVIENLVNQRDTLIILPTGGGKSLCFQIPALIFNGITIVISPLIALMEDQVDQLKEYGIGAVCLNSSISSNEYAKNIELIKNNRIKLIYLAPETLLLERTIELLKSVEISLIAIDEAHCVSEWGHDFRPEYQRIGGIKKMFPSSVLVALTATATPIVRAEISRHFEILDENIFLGSFQRKNLFLDVKEKSKPILQVMEYVEKYRDQSGIIYCATRKDTEYVAEHLISKGYKARAYHAGLSDEKRRENQRLFIRDEVLIMVATIAFGMGIDKPDIRFVLQYDLPKNPESYYQQIGRAGRDGLNSDCLLLFGYSDIHKIKFFIDQKSEEFQRVENLKLKAMIDFASSEECLRKNILNYFGEEYTKDNCGMCINCVSEKAPQKDVTIEAQKFLSCVKRTNEVFGAGYVIDVLRGAKVKKILDLGHDKLSTWGIGKDLSIEEWKSLASSFVQKGLITRDMKYGSLKLTNLAWDVFRGDLKVFVKEKQIPKPKKLKDKVVLDSDEALFNILRKKRKELADDMNLPPYTIFPDKTLLEMGIYYPLSKEELITLHGVGQVKLEKYGDIFLEIIKSYCFENNINKKDQNSFVISEQSRKKTNVRRHIEVGRMFNEGKDFRYIAGAYQVKNETIIKHLTRYLMDGYSLRKTDDFFHFSGVSPGFYEKVSNLFDKYGYEILSPIHEKFNGEISYDILQLLRLHYMMSNR